MLTVWAKAVQMRAALARVHGRMSFNGSAAARPGVVVEVAGVGKRFNGEVLLSAVTHEFKDGAWVTHAAFGLDADSPRGRSRRWR